MEENEYKWKVGELVSVPKQSEKVKGGRLKEYHHYISSRYVCIREAADGQPGILLKVLGKTDSPNIMMIGGEPFVKDDKDESFTGDTYFSFRFPTTDELKLVLEILQNNPDLIPKFDKGTSHFKPESSFWVRETARRFFIEKQFQFYDARTKTLARSNNPFDVNYRVTIAYFDKSRIWS